LAKKAGVQPPTNWQELKDFATALKAKGGDTDRPTRSNPCNNRPRRSAPAP